MIDARTVSTATTTRISNVARDVTYTDLRSLLFPNGARTADPALVVYIRNLLGNDKIAIGPILTNADFATLRQRLSACIIARASRPCPDGSLSEFVQ